MLTVSDVDSGQTVFAAVAAGDLIGTYGTFTFNETTGAWTYTLDPDLSDGLVDAQEVNDTLTVASIDGTASETITVDIVGANDAATITVSDSEDMGVTEAGGVDNSTAGDPDASGVLTVSDVDSGQTVFAAVAAGDLIGTYGTFTFNETTGAWTYTLDPDLSDGLVDAQEVNDTLTVASIDGTASETITVDIVGANDAPEMTASGVLVNATEGNGSVIVDGGFLIADIDSVYLHSATMELTTDSNLDFLQYDELNGISGIFDQVTDTLTLTGNATVSEYEAALRSISFQAEGASVEMRTAEITTSVFDGTNHSADVTTAVSIMAMAT